MGPDPLADIKCIAEELLDAARDLEGKAEEGSPEHQLATEVIAACETFLRAEEGHDDVQPVG